VLAPCFAPRTGISDQLEFSVRSASCARDRNGQPARSVLDCARRIWLDDADSIVNRVRLREQAEVDGVDERRQAAVRAFRLATAPYAISTRYVRTIIAAERRLRRTQ
jgi:hypothetical protein